MVSWMTELSRERIKAGRLVLLEHPWSSDLLREPPKIDLVGIRDPITDEPFEFIRCGQCMYGAADRDSRRPYKASSAIGTNSRHIEELLGNLCDGSHQHEIVEGSKSAGKRTTQKAHWLEKLCRAIRNAVRLELDSRRNLCVFPAGETDFEERSENHGGFLDEPGPDEDSNIPGKEPEHGREGEEEPVE